jgi:hypothetical protein
MQKSTEQNRLILKGDDKNCRYSFLAADDDSSSSKKSRGKKSYKFLP